MRPCLENNADTPTSVYESAFWQWIWLEDQVNARALSWHSDQFNSLQEKLVARFAEIAQSHHPQETLHFACCQGSDEDLGTVCYLRDCAEEAGIATELVYIEDIGHGEGDVLVDLQEQVITWLFKLHPWECLLREDYAPLPRFSGNHTLIGSWLVGDQAAGISVREDHSLITQDLSHFIPHVILG